MRKYLLLLPCLLLSALACRAQDKHTWAEGIRDWTGFQIAEPAREGDFHTSFTLLKERRTVRRDGVVYHYLDVTAAALPYQSWVKADAMTPAGLERIAQEFNLIEWFARQYRDERLFTRDKDGARERDYIARFQAARDSLRLDADLLSRYPLGVEPFDITALPVQISDRSVGVSFGFFTGLPLGSLAHLLNPAVGLTLSYELRRDAHAFLLDASIGNSTFRREYYGLNGAWMSRKGVLTFCLSASYSRDLVVSGPWRLSASAGPCYGVRLFSFEGNEAAPLGGPGLSEGIALDYRFHRTLSFSTRHPEQSDVSVRLRLYTDQIWNGRQRNIIPSVNLGVGLHFDNRSLSRR